MIDELKQLGLTHYEGKAITVLLKQKLSLRELSKKAEIPFGKVYSVIKSLKQKGLIMESNSRPKLIYIENASNIISKLIKEKQESQINLFQGLRDIATEIDKDKKQVTKFFEIGTTIEDNKRIQLRSFREAEDEVLQIINIHHKPKSNRESKTLWEKEIEKAVKRGVIFRAIYPKTAELPLILKNLNQKHPNKFQVKRIDTDFIRCDIIDKKKVLLKLVHQDPLQFGGVFFIENENLAENLTKIFQEMWEQD